MATARPARRRAVAPDPDPDPVPRSEASFHPKGAVVHEAAPNREGPPTVRPGRFPKESIAWLYILGALSYGVGWYLAYTGAIVVLRASDVAFAFVLILLLRAMARIARARIPADGLAAPSAAIAKAGAWSLGIFWGFWTFTNVPQLAVGIAGAILAYQTYASRSRLQREGYAHHARFGPLFVPTLTVFAAYGAWLLLRRFLGPMSGFDLFTAAGALLFTIVMVRIVDRRAQRAAAVPVRREPRQSGAPRRGLEQRTLVGVIGGYLFFRFFISSSIPYGPIVEWFIVCLGALFVAVMMADRIGVVPTRRSLPHPDLRSHVQRIVSLPDRDLQETDERLSAFIQSGRDAEWVLERFRGLFQEAELPAEVQTRHLTPLVPSDDKRRHAPVQQMGREGREALVVSLIDALRSERRGATGTLKTGPGVRSKDKGPRPVVVPSP